MLTFAESDVAENEPGLRHLVDAKVNIRGPCGTIFNEKKQLMGILMFVPGSKYVSIEEPAFADPYSLPVRPVQTLLGFMPGESPGHRVRVQGIVTAQRGSSIFIKDGTGGLYVESQQETALDPGDLRVLQKKEHSVVLAENGRQAVERFESGSFDLILMDVQMPEMNGFEATAAIREREQGSSRRVPIIAMTAHAMKGDRERCLEGGMDGYVSKPIGMRELMSAIASVVPGSIGHEPSSPKDRGCGPQAQGGSREQSTSRL